MSLEALVLEPVEIHTDPRGSLVKAHPGRVEGEVYVVSAVPGAARGHHLHRRMAEAFVCLRGSCVLGLLDPETQRSRHVELPVGVRAIVPAGLAHALFNVGDDLLVVLACAERPHDPGDVEPVQVPAP
jgi:oxalate decarboxylase/phosphoglucose isomerase-like protein (cupin superfamily)